MYNTYEVKNKNGKVSSVRGIQVNNEFKEILKEFVKLSQEEKAIKEQKESKGNLIREFVRNVRDFFAKKGSVVKTYRIEEKEGNFVYAVDVTASERFSLPSTREDIVKLKKEIGAGIFDQLFEETVTIKIKEIISNNSKKRKELLKLLADAIGEDKVKEFFVKEDSIEIKEGFLEKIYQLSDAEREILLKYIRPSLETVKDVSYTVE